MKKLIIGTALAACISASAMAQDKAVLPVSPKIDMSFVTDTEHNVTKETTATEFGVVAGIKGFGLSVLPNFSWDAEEISNIEFAAGYTFDVTDSFGISPYGEINFNKKFESGDRLIGVKTHYNF
jgi:hypothetical protein